jgi:hypothetical protein
VSDQHQANIRLVRLAIYTTNTIKNLADQLLHILHVDCVIYVPISLHFAARHACFGPMGVLAGAQANK